MIVEPRVTWLPWVLPVIGVLICYIAARIADSARSAKPAAKAKVPAPQ
jgi:hypothetical protein